MARNTLADTMGKNRQLIFNGLKEPEILERLSKLGVGQEALEKAWKLFQVVEGMFGTKDAVYQSKSKLYDDYLLEAGDRQSSFKDLQGIIRMAARKDADLQDRLNIQYMGKVRIEEWINRSAAFIDRVLKEEVFMAQISKYGLSAERLQNEKESILALRGMRDRALAEKGSAEEATRIRDEKLEELEDVCYEIKTIAKIALADKPQLLESLGIVVKR